MHKMLKRTVAAAVVAAPMTLALSGLASADTYGQTSQHTGADGAMSTSQQASTGGHGHGGASYGKTWQQAGPHGADSSSVHSSTGGNGGSGGKGGASYGKTWQHAGPDGASSSGTHASTGGSHQGGGHHSGGLLSSLL